MGVKILKVQSLTTSERIRIMMGRRKISSQHLAKKLRISPQAFNHNLRTGNWKIKRLETLAKYFNVELNDLL
jgi:DNA-binding Xre family transcriptional regulator